MIHPPPRSTRTNTLFPYTTLFRSLEQAYEGLPKTGFGRIAVLEAAMTEDKPVLWAIRADGKPAIALAAPARRSEEHTSELQSLLRTSYAVFCLKTKNDSNKKHNQTH